MLREEMPLSSLAMAVTSEMYKLKGSWIRQGSPPPIWQQPTAQTSSSVPATGCLQRTASSKHTGEETVNTGFLWLLTVTAVRAASRDSHWGFTLYCVKHLQSQVCEGAKKWFACGPWAEWEQVSVLPSCFTDHGKQHCCVIRYLRSIQLCWGICGGRGREGGPAALERCIITVLLSTFF